MMVEDPPETPIRIDHLTIHDLVAYLMAREDPDPGRDRETS